MLEIIKVPNKELQKEIKGKYPYCDGLILTWLHDRIENYLNDKTQAI